MAFPIEKYKDNPNSSINSNMQRESSIKHSNSNQQQLNANNIYELSRKSTLNIETLNTNLLNG